MKRKALIITILAVTGTLLLGQGCIMEDKIIELVLTNSTCGDFDENHAQMAFVTPAVVQLGDELDEILEENGVSRDDITEMLIVSAYYEVTDFPHTHDWEISGSITVERTDAADGPETLINYTEQSLLAALGTRTRVSLAPAGTGVLERALDSFRLGTDPSLLFEINNGTVDPPPSSVDSLIFDWNACIVLHVIVAQELEVPDPF